MTTLVRRGPVVVPGPAQPVERCVACGATTGKISRKVYERNDLELCEDATSCLDRYRMGMTLPAYLVYLNARKVLVEPMMR
jgi:hypothetical protein